MSVVGNYPLNIYKLLILIFVSFKLVYGPLYTWLNN